MNRCKYGRRPIDIIIDLLYIIGSVLALWKGADWVVESAGRIGKRFGMSEVVIGLTIVAFGTSAPEFAVTLAAALEGQADISVGNVIGSNIFNLGFVLGGVAAVRAIQTNVTLIRRDGFVLIGTTILLLAFIAPDLILSPLEGTLLLLALASYLGYLIWRRKAIELEEEIGGQANWKDGVLLLAGLTLVIGGGHFLVDHASSLAERFGISAWVIGVTIVAAGTSAPELVISLNAVLRGRHGISIGNLIGSDIFNLQGVLGLAAVVSPLGSSGQVMQVDPGAAGSIGLLILMVVLVVLFMRTGWAISRKEGAFLVIVNLARWVLDFTT